MSQTLKLFHTGYVEIPAPDVHYGRKNADFGQGFYLTRDEEFAMRWARERKGAPPVLNAYELELEGLEVLHLERDATWFEYVFANRRTRDVHPEADVVIGPIANDTIYDTLGVITSGLLAPEQALRLLMIGPCYEQIVLKTPRAAANLRFLGSRVLGPDEVARHRALVAKEQEEYLRLFGEAVEEL